MNLPVAKKVFFASSKCPKYIHSVVSNRLMHLAQSTKEGKKS